MGSNKLFGAHGGLSLQSQVASETGQTVSELYGFRHSKPPINVHLENMNFFVGARAHDWGRPIENLDYDRLAGVPETRAIIYASLSRYIEQHGPIEGQVQMLVGLPLEPLSGQDAQANADAVRQWLRGEHSWEADGKPYHITISEVRITSQPTGALFEYILDDSGQFIPERKAHFSEEIGILSIGFNTVEMLGIKDRAPIQAMTAGRTSGVRRLLELLNTQGMYSLGEMDERLRAGRLDVKAVLPIWSREVTGQIEKTWGQRWRRFARIIAVGGGVLLLKDALIERFNGKVYIPSDPVMAIAHGLYKLALMQSNRRSKA
jgi:hypothetical protein